MPEAVSETKLLAGRECNTELSVLLEAEPASLVVLEQSVECRSGAKPGGSGRVGTRGEMPFVVRHVVSTFISLTVILAGCGSRPRNGEGPLFGTGVFHPPPKPGASISQTRMCECKVCEPSNCCDGPDDDAPPASCGDSYDLSNEACAGISIRSCASRCTRQVWRVNSAQSCAARRPDSCCEAG